MAEEELETGTVGLEAALDDAAVEPDYVLDDGRELYEHFRFTAERGSSCCASTSS